jgi:dTDP-glucose 4,6-dehydratase
MHVLVTGGAGFIGTNFIRLAMKNDLNEISKITVLDKLTYAGIKENISEFTVSPKFNFIEGDISDSNTVKSIISEVDSVVNFAAESHVDRSINNSTDFVNSNILGVQVLLEAIRIVGKKKRFLQVSTDEVYGSIKKGSWDELSPIKPNSPYSASKASAEHFVNSYHHTYGLTTLITRSSNNYGPYQYPEKIIPLFITNIIEGKKLPLYGNGKNVRDWLHVDDHCRGLYKVLINGKSGDTYNIGGGTELTNEALTMMILTKMGFEFSQVQYVEDRLGHDFRYSVNWLKIHDSLGYSPEILFEEGITKTISWYLENKSWWQQIKKS